MNQEIIWPVHKLLILSFVCAFVLVAATVAAQSLLGVNIQQLVAGIITGQFLSNGIQAAHNTSVINSPTNGLFPPPTSATLPPPPKP